MNKTDKNYIQRTVFAMSQQWWQWNNLWSVNNPIWLNNQIESTNYSIVVVIVRPVLENVPLTIRRLVHIINTISEYTLWNMVSGITRWAFVIVHFSDFLFQDIGHRLKIDWLRTRGNFYVIIIDPCWSQQCSGRAHSSPTRSRFPKRSEGVFQQIPEWQ